MAHQDRDIVERRLERVRREYIKPAIWGPRRTMDAEMWAVPDEPDGTVGEPVPVATAVAATDWVPVRPGTAWGRPWGTVWFRLSGQVPTEWSGRPVEAVLNLGFNDLAPGFMGEGLVWRRGALGEWEPERGLHPANHTVRVTDAADGGDEVSFLVEGSANPLMWGLESTSNSDRDTAGSHPLYVVSAIDLAVINLDVWGLHHDLRVLRGLMNELPLDGARRWEILVALDAALDALDLEDIVGSAVGARAELSEVLARPAVPSAHRLSAVGHAHIDTAWLWPLRETRRKVARSFTNALRLAEDEPEFRFACSQAVQYDWMREQYPSVFDDIVDTVHRGQWIPVGGSWVEADGNVTGGESMARQFLHGQRFFREHFGITCREVWIPDVFGYPASFPQLFRLGGCERFLTQKMSWNRTNRFPHHSFEWEGIDGSRVFTHFPPADTYSAVIEPFEMAKAERQFADKGRATRSMLLFGHGDGGGGPARDMMERYRRLRDIEGLPRIEIESPADFFDAAIEEYVDPPVWVGELYFEMHRGTYTSQARTKVGNRRCEILLREAELWSVVAFGGLASDGYPAATLDRLWKEVLTLQFHDILPGSSIGWVHRETEAAHTRIIDELEGLIDAALSRIGRGTRADSVVGGGTVVEGETEVGRSTVVEGRMDLVVNAAPHDRDEVVLLEVSAASEQPGLPVHTQLLGDGRRAQRVAVPALGIAPLEPLPISEPIEVDVQGQLTVIDNGIIRVAIDERGTVSSYLHLGTSREVIAPGGRGGLVQLHADLPLEYDAWDIEEYYRRNVVDIDDVDSIEVTDHGPLVARVRVERSFRSSRLVQTYELRAGSPRLDVHLEIDWAERNHLLKLAWPVDVHANDVNRHIQYGHTKTPIHTNTTWDAARFEVCAHHWIDVGEPGFGVALLNDGRYGHDVTRTRAADGSPTTMMRLTLLKGAIYPDPRADLGRHEFTCAVLPHAGRFRKEGVVAEGYRLNMPVRTVSGNSAGAWTGAFAEVDRDSVVIEAVKAAEDGSGDVIVRCYESYGGRADATITLAAGLPGFGSVRLTNFLEDDPPPEPHPGLVQIDGHTVRLSLRPFQIATLRFSNG